MRVDTLFRLSTYLTLAAASLCLCYAEVAFLPWIWAFGAGMGLVLAAAFAIEGRWALTIPWANALGLVIAASAGFWIAYHFLHPLDLADQVAARPAAILPYVGPILMVLLLAKLFRPKQINDYWLIHSIGLMEVTLACVLASQPLFGLFLVAYLICGLWSLAVFYLYREQRACLDEQGTRRKVKGEREKSPGLASFRPSPFAEAVPWRFLGVCRAGLWACWILIFGLVLFLFTPQHGGDLRWDSLTLSGGKRPPMLMGFSPDIDLNRTGRLAPSSDPAMEIKAWDGQGEPKRDLSPEQRWRGTTLDWYEGGRWGRQAAAGPLAQPRSWRPDFLGPSTSRTDLPDLGPNQYFFLFRVRPGGLPTLFLADPVVLNPKVYQPPVVFNGPTRWPRLFQEYDCTLAPVLSRAWATIPHFEYQQVTAPLPEPDVSEPLPDRLTQMIKPLDLCNQPVGGIYRWTADLMDRLVAEGRLSAQDRQTEPILSGQSRWPSQDQSPIGPADQTDFSLATNGQLWPAQSILPENREKVARALCHHLALSGEYAYSLNLQRRDPRLDPAEDFLKNVKQGHCERYAAGLALMLRSCGIPARVVVGFRGAEKHSRKGDGWYLVRQSHAHAWVEALIERPGPGGRRELRWLTLDPTPGLDASQGDAFSWKQLWEDGEDTSQLLWKNFIIEYDTSQRSETATALWDRWGPNGRLGRAWAWLHEKPLTMSFWVEAAPWTVGLTAGALIFVAARRLRVRRKALPVSHGVSTGFYGRLLAVLDSRCGLRPRPSQTPREFAETAEQTLRPRTSRLDLALLPQRLIGLFYRVRYGHVPLDHAQDAQVRRQIDELDSNLDRGGSVDGPEKCPNRPERR